MEMANYSLRGDYIYDGVRFCELNDAEVLETMKKIQFSPEDLIIASYPKCGNAWVKFLVYLILHDGDVTVGGSHTDAQIPTLEFDRLKSVEEFSAKPPPRTAATHLPMRFYPAAVKNRSKFIVIQRNLKDVLVSYYHNYRMFDGAGFYTGTWDDFFEIFKAGRLYAGDYVQFYNQWWEEMHSGDKDDISNVLFLRYEDMKSDLRSAVSSIAAFLKTDLSEELLDKITGEATFDKMKENNHANRQALADTGLVDFSISHYMRKGIVGDWRDYFSQEQSDIVDAMLKQQLPPALYSHQE